MRKVLFVVMTLLFIACNEEAPKRGFSDNKIDKSVTATQGATCLNTDGRKYNFQLSRKVGIHDTEDFDLYVNNLNQFKIEVLTDEKMSSYSVSCVFDKLGLELNFERDENNESYVANVNFESMETYDFLNCKVENKEQEILYEEKVEVLKDILIEGEVKVSEVLEEHDLSYDDELYVGNLIFKDGASLEFELSAPEDFSFYPSGIFVETDGKAVIKTENKMNSVVTSRLNSVSILHHSNKDMYLSKVNHSINPSDTQGELIFKDIVLNIDSENEEGKLYIDNVKIDFN